MDDIAGQLTHRLAVDLDDGFAELVRVHAPAVRTYLLRLSGSTADADDLGQDTFLRAYLALREYPPARRQALHPRAWLMSIATNVWRNDVRTRSRRPTAAQRLEDSSDAWPDEGASPEEQAANAADRKVLVEALAELPERYRIAIVLRHVIGMSYAEVAETQGCPVGTVKAQVSRGLSSLRELLKSPETRLGEVTT